MCSDIKWIINAKTAKQIQLSADKMWVKKMKIIHLHIWWGGGGGDLVIFGYNENYTDTFFEFRDENDFFREGTLLP